MSDVKSTIENCTIPVDSKIGNMVTLLNTTLGKSCMVGNFSKMAYTQMGDLSYIEDYTIVINAMIKKL